MSPREAELRRAGATALTLFWLDVSGVLPHGGGRWKVFATAILGRRPVD